MQKRHKNPAQYFQEGATSCRDYYIPYITGNTSLKFGPGCRVLEVGCGLGGSLSVFAESGCVVTGVDLSEGSVELARELFAAQGLAGTFVAADALEWQTDERYDLIMLHDAIEHIDHKERLMARLGELLADSGVLFMGFPAWQMPFGGHQQMANSPVLSHFPYLHLLPEWLLRTMFRLFGQNESPEWILELRDTGISIERFERLAAQSGFRIIDRRLWLINPHYRAKFGLRPQKLPATVAAIPRFRNYLTTSCFYLLEKA